VLLALGLGIDVLAKPSRSGPLEQSTQMRTFPLRIAHCSGARMRPGMKWIKKRGNWMWNDLASSLTNLASTLAWLDPMAG
jgi:hypothetical protein